MAAPHPIGAPSGTTGQAAGRSLDELVGDWRDASILGSSPASVRRAAAVVRRFIAAMGIRSAGGIDASAWLGHRDIRTTEPYSHLCPGYDEDIELASPPVEAKGASDGQLPLSPL